MLNLDLTKIPSGSNIQIKLTDQEATNYAENYLTSHIDEVKALINQKVKTNLDVSNPEIHFDEDEVFISEGEYGQFVKLWLNGEVLTEGVDYTKEPGSTRIIINAESLEDKTNEGRNTISAEFNVDEERGEKLKRTSQNFRVELTTEDNNPTDDPVKPADQGDTDEPAKPADSNKQKNTNSTAGTSTSEAEDSEDEEAATANIITHVVGADDKPLANHRIEMHSTVKTASTDSSGNASFSSMEMGAHTVYIQDEGGTTLASKGFTLKAGSSLSMDGDTITVVPGQSVMMTIKVEGSKASIVSVKATNSALTGDASNANLWMILIIISAAVLAGVHYYRKRQDA